MTTTPKRPPYDAPNVTLRKLQAAHSALRIISTWATARNGLALDPRHVAKLCKEALNAK